MASNSTPPKSFATAPSSPPLLPSQATPPQGLLPLHELLLSISQKSPQELVSALSLGFVSEESTGTPLVVALALAWVVGAMFLLLFVVYIGVYAIAHFPRKAEPSENTYVTVTPSGEVSEPRALPRPGAHCEDEDIQISVVVPAYNEVARLGVMLEETVRVLEEWEGAAWEILIVDDGSKDGTAQTALEFARERGIAEDAFRVCRLVKNRGKGGAVTHGMQRARGKHILFADADGASKFADAQKLQAALQGGAEIAVGSRAHLVNTEAVVKRSFVRNFMMHCLHTLLYVFGVRSVGDTQCGFKMFTRSAVARIFPYMHNEGWIFDVEVLILAERKGVVVAEVPISWHEVAGSKVELAKDSVRMAVDLVAIRSAYALGIYDDGRRRRPVRAKEE
ncbi:nucleotide-diphospho-sugar transferase [Limtongia smithiae]|uniref:nucleotide-diphospho-sugar transferase n=1 Tax=Limtongia smithiae TaxID=1125753 RepID=UPI0034CEEA25